MFESASTSDNIHVSVNLLFSSNCCCCSSCFWSCCSCSCCSCCCSTVSSSSFNSSSPHSSAVLLLQLILITINSTLEANKRFAAYPFQAVQAIIEHMDRYIISRLTIPLASRPASERTISCVCVRAHCFGCSALSDSQGCPTLTPQSHRDGHRERRGVRQRGAVCIGAVMRAMQQIHRRRCPDALRRARWHL